MAQVKGSSKHQKNSPSSEPAYKEGPFAKLAPEPILPLPSPLVAYVAPEPNYDEEAWQLARFIVECLIQRTGKACVDYAADAWALVKSFYEEADKFALDTP